MGLGEPLTHNSRGCTGIDEIVDDQLTITVSGTGFLENMGRTLILMVEGRDSDGFDMVNIQLSADDQFWYQTTPGNRNDAVERSRLQEPPG